METAAIEKARGFWLRRSQSKGDSTQQTTRVSSLLRSAVLPTEFYESALDLGCGRGRFVPILSSFCGHVWAVDIVPEILCDIEFRSEAATAFCIDDKYRLPSGPHDLLWSAFFFQHIVDQNQFKSVCMEIRRVMKPGARVFMLENAKDRAAHVRPRTPHEYAESLGLAEHASKLVTINERPNDHWWVEGRFK